MTTRAAIYARISSDPRGEGLGVARQVADCQDRAEAMGLEVVGTWVDNDVSAYSGKLRPQYAALMEAIRGGEVDRVIAWHPDRLHRSPRELEAFIDVLDATGVRVTTCQTGDWDLSTSSGRMMARYLGVAARYESEHKSERVKRKWIANAAEGRRHGHRAYGWDLMTTTTGVVEVVNSAEATVVREIAEDLLAGHSLRAITAGLNADDVPSPRGKPWTSRTVNVLVSRERNVANRVHHGEVLGKGQWDPILSQGVFDQVKAILADPTRKTTSSTVASHLLSGIATCGKCGAVLWAGSNRGYPSYRCQRGCVSRLKVVVDREVTVHLLDLLGRPDALDLLAPTSTHEVAQARAEELELRAILEQAAVSAANKRIPVSQLELINATLKPQIAAAMKAGTPPVLGTMLQGLSGPGAEGVWEAMTISAQRTVVAQLLVIKVEPQGRGRGKVPADYIKITRRDLEASI